MRHYLGISSAGPTVFRNVRRDVTGEPLLLVDQDAACRLRVNFSDWLESGETISSITVSGESCTVSSALSSPNVTLTISAVTNSYDGRITLKATASTGEIWRGIIRVRRPNRYGDEQPFRDYV